MGLCPADGQLGPHVAGGVGETGFLPSHCLVLFFGFCFLCSFHSFFSPFKFHIWSNYCSCTLLSWRCRKSVPLSGGAVPSHRTCILVTGLLRKPRCSRRKPAGETCLGYSWLWHTPTYHVLGIVFSVFGRSKTTLTQMLHWQHTHLLFFLFKTSFYSYKRKVIVGLTHMKTVMTLEYQDTTQTLGLDSVNIFLTECQLGLFTGRWDPDGLPQMRSPFFWFQRREL